MKRVARTVTSKEDINFLLSINEEETTKLSFIMECFGEFDGKERFDPYDLVIIPPNSYGPEGNKNENAFTTTVGLWVFNKCFIEKELFDIFGYINEPITKKKFGKINTKLSHSVIEDKISLDALKHFILKTQKYQPYCNILCHSITESMMEIPSKLADKKKKLFEKYKTELDNNDPITSEKIEKELLDDCKEILKDDPSMDMINSGSKITWENNFKNMFVMRGAVKEADPTKGGFKIIKSNFMEGVTAEDYTDFANSLTGGPYSRAKKTEVGGAWEKLFVKAFQHIHVLPDGTDCHTKRVLTVKLTESNIQDYWIYSYIVEGNKYIELTSDLIDKYVGKTVKIRFSGLCEEKTGICSICAGHLFNRIGMNQVGVSTYQIPSVIKVKSMKAFHDGTVKVTDMEDYGLMKVFGLEE